MSTSDLLREASCWLLATGIVRSAAGRLCEERWMHSTNSVACYYCLRLQPAKLPTLAGAPSAYWESAADAELDAYLHAASGGKAEG